MNRIIKNTADYEAALGEIEKLMDIDPKSNSAEAEQLELLALLVHDYEAKAVPKTLPDAVDAILFRMEQQNLTPRSLIPYIGSRSKVSEVLSRKRPLTLSMIRALHDGLGIPAQVLIQQSSALGHDEEPDWNQFPIKEMVARGWISDSIRSVRAFFSKLPAMAQSAVLLRKTKHIRSARNMDDFALAAWVTRVIIRSKQLSRLSKYRKGSVTLDFMRELAKCSVLENGPSAACDFLAKRGIPLIIEPHLPHTYLDGAAILILTDRPVIGMTLRHDRLDNFWFTLMHELAHVALHSGQESKEFIDDLDVEAQDDPKEREADEFAGEALIPKDVWRRSPASRDPSPEAAHHLATTLGIHPAIAAGRMRHEQKAFRLLNHLVGHRGVRQKFPEIKWPN